MYFHKDLTQEQWEDMDFFRQMANMGAEFGRAENWILKDKKISEAAFFRGVELLDATILDSKNRKHLKELCRLREAIGSDLKDWDKYFLPFNYASIEK